MMKTVSVVILKLTGKEAIMPQQTFKIAKIQMTAIPCRSISLLAQIIFGKLRQRKLHFVDDIFQDRKAEQLRSPTASMPKRSERRTGEIIFLPLAINMKKHMLRKRTVTPVRDSKKSKKTTQHMSMTQNNFHVMYCIFGLV